MSTTPRQQQHAPKVAALGLALGLLLDFRAGAQGPRRAEHWVGTWATALVSSQQTLHLSAAYRRLPPPASRNPLARPSPATPPIESFNNQTLRQIVHTTIGGSRARIVFSNAFGTSPLRIGAAHVALHARAAAIDSASGRRVTFNGQSATTIPAGAVMFSDPVDLMVPSFADLAIDAYLSGDTAGTPLTTHPTAFQTSFLSEPGNHAGKDRFPVARTVTSWFFLARVEVTAPSSVGAVVAFGDSTTEGMGSTPNANRRWPDQLARRLAHANGTGMAVLNLGIGGNRLLDDGLGVSALARFDRDVAVQTGVTHVIVFEGINDIGYAATDPTPTAADLITAHQQLIARGHALGLTIIGATMTPYEGAFYATSAGEAKRQTVNQWIRTSRAYDAVIDFDAAVRDARQPARLSKTYDPGDHLHPNDAGYRALAEAVDLRLFGSGLSTR